jgi:hypothetical protein
MPREPVGTRHVRRKRQQAQPAAGPLPEPVEDLTRGDVNRRRIMRTDRAGFTRDERALEVKPRDMAGEHGIVFQRAHDDREIAAQQRLVIGDQGRQKRRSAALQQRARGMNKAFLGEGFAAEVHTDKTVHLEIDKAGDF